MMSEAFRWRWSTSSLEPESRKPPKKIPPTPEQIAKVVTAKLKSPVGQLDKAEITLRLVLPRAVLERLMARASRESYPSLAAWVEAVLEREGKGQASMSQSDAGRQ
jgi:hypothetical protein